MKALRVAILLTVCSLAGALGGASRAEEAKPVRVFLLFSYSFGTWARGITSGIETSLVLRKVPYRLEPYYGEHFLEWESRSPEARAAEIQDIVQRLKRFQPDYVVVADDEAADAVIPTLKSLPYPIVFTGINRQETSIAWLKDGRERIGGVFERYPKAETLKLLGDLTGGSVRRISILTSKTETSDVVLEEFKQFFADTKPKIKLDKIYRSSSWPEWQAAVREANARGAAIWILLPWDVFKPGEAKPVHLREMGAWLSTHLSVPSVSIVDVGLHVGAMASVSITPEMLGEEVAKIIDKSLKENVSVGTLPLAYPDRSELVINQRAVQRLKIKVPISILEYARILKEEPVPTRQ